MLTPPRLGKSIIICNSSIPRKSGVLNWSEFYQFELDKPKLETANHKHWRDYFKTGKAGTDAPEYIKKASRIIEWINLSEEERDVLSTLERLEANEQAERDYLVGESKAEERTAIAKNLIKSNFGLDDIANATGLSIAKLQELKDEMRV